MKSKDSSAILTDTQASLAAALARLEGIRVREKHLLSENIRLKALLRDHGISEDGQSDAATTASPHSTDRPAALQRVRTKRASDDAHAPVSFHAAEPHPVFIVTQDGKLPANLYAEGSCMEFVEVKARVSPSEYVGIRAVSGSNPAANQPAPKEKLQLSRYSWMGSLFSGLSQENEPPDAYPTTKSSLTFAQCMRVDRPSDGSFDIEPHPIASGVGSGDESGVAGQFSGLVRHSWNGVVGPDASSGGAEGTRAGKCVQAASASESAWGGWEEDDGNGRGVGRWQVIWKEGGGEGKLQQVTFEASYATRAAIHQQVEAWTHAHATGMDPQHLAATAAPMSPTISRAVGERTTLDASKAGPLEGEGRPGVSGDAGMEAPAQGMTLPGGDFAAAGVGASVHPPKHLQPLGLMPKVEGDSVLLSRHHVCALASAVPPRYRQARWSLQYSTAQDGFSLQTLYRGCSKSPCILVIRDAAGYVFGAFTPCGWKIAPRYYGTGETFVFQLQPHMVYWTWDQDCHDRNDFFMFGAPDNLGVGGGPRFALWLDGELLYGTSGTSATFACPCLASNDEFKIMAVEVWALL